jgi:dipeptidyl aminopeptidase/acylaminoacyl peptidase
MRIIGGRLRGKALAAPPGQTTRPTADRVRQALFDMLWHRYPGWRAAVEGAALNDWLLDYTIAYYQEGDLYFFGGSPYGKDAATAKLWREQSPIALAGKATAPTLILGDAGDPNVPIVNSYEMYHALKDHGVPVEFYVYPADTHFPGDLVHMTDVCQRWVAWMEQHLK